MSEQQSKQKTDAAAPIAAVCFICKGELPIDKPLEIVITTVAVCPTCVNRLNNLNAWTLPRSHPGVRI